MKDVRVGIWLGDTNQRHHERTTTVLSRNNTQPGQRISLPSSIRLLRHLAVPGTSHPQELYIKGRRHALTFTRAADSSVLSSYLNRSNPGTERARERECVCRRSNKNTYYYRPSCVAEMEERYLEKVDTWTADGRLAGDAAVVVGVE